MTEITGKCPFPLSYLSTQSGKWVQFSKVYKLIILIDLNHREMTRFTSEIPLCTHLHLQVSAYCKYFLQASNQEITFVYIKVLLKCEYMLKMKHMLLWLSL